MKKKGKNKNKKKKPSTSELTLLPMYNGQQKNKPPKKNTNFSFNNGTVGTSQLELPYIGNRNITGNTVFIENQHPVRLTIIFDGKDLPFLDSKTFLIIWFRSKRIQSLCLSWLDCSV